MAKLIHYNHEFLNENLNGWHVQTIFDDIASTNSYLKEHTSSLMDKTIVLANQQSFGRGRYQRSFKSTRDKGIFCSFLIKHVKIQSMPHLSFACALALVLSIYTLYQIKTQIKWPNDLLLNNKKLAGILIETMYQAETMDVVIGFGLNIYHQDFKNLNAISLEDVHPLEIDRNILLIHYFKTFDELMHSRNIIDLYRKWMIPRDEYISTTIEGTKTYVTLLDIQEDGTLLVKKDNGKIIILFNEEIQNL